MTFSPTPRIQSSVAKALQIHLGSLPDRDARVLELGSLSPELIASWRSALGKEPEFLDAAPGPDEIRLDVVMDSSSEPAAARIDTFNSLAGKMASGGCYLCYIGDPTDRETAALLQEYFCSLLDDLHAFHKRGKKADGFEASMFTGCVPSIHFYPALIVIEFEPRVKPKMVYTGEPQF